jgi:uncharacterized coiled-coil protein SlyX
VSKPGEIIDIGETDRLRDRIEFLEGKVKNLEADLAAMEAGHIARYKFASDAAIAEWADVQPNEQAKEIARLKYMLAREQTKSEEVGKAHSLLITRLQMRRKQITEAEFDRG